MSALAECTKGFINALTARPRQQLRVLLSTVKTLTQIELARIQAMLAQQDVLANTFTTVISGFEETLKPLEEALNQIPFKEFKACESVSKLDLDIQNIYFDRKNELRSLTYKYTQFGFANTYFGDYRSKLENQLDQVTAMLNYLDNLATFNLERGDVVRVYTQNEDSKGNKYPVTLSGHIPTVGEYPSAVIVGINIVVKLDDTGDIKQFKGTEVQKT